MSQSAKPSRIKAKSRFIIANITWNDSGWRNTYVNPKAGAKPVREVPGHESLNFEFNKKGVDDESHVFGYLQWWGRPRRFEEPGIIFFFTNNLDKKRNEIVGVYGDAKILDKPLNRRWEGFENNELISNIKAVKEKSILFPIPLDANQYSKGKRLVPQAGLRYISQDLASMMITDEINTFEKSGARKDELDKLFSIFETITGKKYILNSDDQEQLELDEIMKNVSKDELRKKLKNIVPQNHESTKINGKTYKRDNIFITYLKKFRDYKCQICGTAIRKKDGGYYVEAAHIKMKSKKGPETLDNLLILCPNHHKEFDYGDREIIKHTEKEISFKMNGNKYKINLKL